MCRLLSGLALLILGATVLAPSAHAQANCGAGTYYDPATDSCVAQQSYDPGYYNGGYYQFCVNGWIFSFCAGR